MRAARLAVLALVVASAVASAVAPPVAAMSLATTYLCFFDTGSAELSPRTQASVLEFADFWHRMRRGEVRAWPDEAPMRAYTMQVEVRGHTDAAETTAGETSLDKARAEAVAAFLQMNGVPADAIKVVAFGSERPLVVASGAEPQNRRAELIAR